MRRAAAFVSATVAAALVVGSAVAPASAAPTQDPPPPGLLPPIDCSILALVGDTACDLIEQIEGALAPVTQPLTEPLAPVLEPVLGALPAPAPAPAPASAPAPEPAPAPGAAPAPASPKAQATSSGTATTADLGAQPGGEIAALARTSRVPSLPAGRTLELRPLGVPSLGLAGTPLASPEALATGESAAGDVVLPAAQAAAELPDGSKATAAVLAVSMLMLAVGLLVDQLRKARQPLQL